jgi:hypothetical protein
MKVLDKDSYSMGIAKCRPAASSGKAVVLWEVTGVSTTETAGVWVLTR